MMNKEHNCSLHISNELLTEHKISTKVNLYLLSRIVYTMYISIKITSNIRILKKAKGTNQHITKL